MNYVKEMIKFFNDMAKTKRMQPHTVFFEMIELTYNRQIGVLGEVLHELNAANKKGLGQCMTPPDIASLLGKICSRYKAQNQRCNDDEWLRISDETGCGTGALILSQLQTLDLSKHKKVLIRFVDLDDVMLKAAYLQINANIALHMPEGIEFKTMPICANTLTLQY
ncbi:hypothetical protein AUQ44_03515 [Vibrio cidicii]|uniref:DNA methylase adenine-specific domain-containing protein n=1 Tax=Vibrio cidicii TaxID=1763883 RepID=A0A151JGK5_9VIBR|nr:hypothetical protein [Vibrio cidicii]KYN24911.1 hypothetical protein AUQ44_03515 [Vibrio cidicii]